MTEKSYFDEFKPKHQNAYKRAVRRLNDLFKVTGCPTNSFIRAYNPWNCEIAIYEISDNVMEDCVTIHIICHKAIKIYLNNLSLTDYELYTLTDIIKEMESELND